MTADPLPATIFGLAAKVEAAAAGGPATKAIGAMKLSPPPVTSAFWFCASGVWYVAEA